MLKCSWNSTKFVFLKSLNFCVKVQKLNHVSIFIFYLQFKKLKSLREDQLHEDCVLFPTKFTSSTKIFGWPKNFVRRKRMINRRFCWSEERFVHSTNLGRSNILRFPVQQISLIFWLILPKTRLWKFFYWITELEIVSVEKLGSPWLWISRYVKNVLLLFTTSFFRTRRAIRFFQISIMKSTFSKSFFPTESDFWVSLARARQKVLRDFRHFKIKTYFLQ